jgi:hypothetical protein
MSTTTPEGEPTEPTRWHVCAVCDDPHGTFHYWPFICCEACFEGFEDTLQRAYEEYRARRKKDDRA